MFIDKHLLLALKLTAAREDIYNIMYNFQRSFSFFSFAENLGLQGRHSEGGLPVSIHTEAKRLPMKTETPV